MEAVVEEYRVSVEFDFYDRLLELEACAKIWALERKRLAAEPENNQARQAVTQMEDVLLKAVGELPARH